jgi:quinoprotein glucose dehydrogenase
MLKITVVSALSRAFFIATVLTGCSLTAAEFIAEKAGYSPKVAAVSDEGEAAMKRFRLPKGLKVELFAAEPLLANPVAFCIDEQGRFYVAETFRLHAGATDIRGHMDWLDEELAVKTVEERIAYMTKHEGGKIGDYPNSPTWSGSPRFHGDGKADKATVFAEGFNLALPTASVPVCLRTGNVYLADIQISGSARHQGRRHGGTREIAYGYGIRVDSRA